ncbi:hypothetical protein GGD41_002021 [Paraburkholderia bryophila]|uniref:Uncharacterized protein n=1 Tax=Paraburkholderia bryophila TaxID=420952 RepID=A0A7Z0AZH1_9BURK|nr:hypothetical protein [Paraburkholderia bryophila]
MLGLADLIGAMHRPAQEDRAVASTDKHTRYIETGRPSQRLPTCSRQNTAYEHSAMIGMNSPSGVPAVVPHGLNCGVPEGVPEPISLV